MFKRFFIFIACALIMGAPQMGAPQLRAASQGAALAQPQPEVDVLLKQGVAASNALKYDESLRLHQAALEKARLLGDKVGEAMALHNIGVAYDNKREPRRALQFLQEAVPLWRALGDRAREADTLDSIGAVLASTGQPRQALRFLEEVLPIWQQLGLKASEAITRNTMGKAWRALGQPRRALQCFEQVLALRRALGDIKGTAPVLGNIGIMHGDLGEPQQALKFFAESLALSRAAGNRISEAATLGNIAFTYQALGRPDAALKIFHQTLALQRSLGDKSGQATALSNIGAVLDNIGQSQKALRFFEQALPLLQAVEDKSGEIATLSNIGLAWDNLGQPQKALAFYAHALPLSRAIEDKKGQAQTLHNMGGIYRAIGQPQKALELFNAALPLSLALEDKTMQAGTLNNIGIVWRLLHRPAEALKFHRQALPLFEAVDDKRGAATTLLCTGLALADLRQAQRALNFYERALPILRQVQDKRAEARTLNTLGRTWRSLKQAPKALILHRQALALRRAIGDRDGQAESLADIAAIEEESGRWSDAGRNLRAALAIWEAMRSSLGDLAEAKVAFLESNLPVYHRYVHLLLQRGDRAGAFAWAQKTKARGLLDLMAVGKVDITKGASAAEQAREQALKRQMARLNTLLIAAGAQAHNGARLATLKPQLARSQRDLETFEDALYAKHPDLARQRAARTTNLGEVPKFLPDDSALLDYVSLQSGALDQTMLFCLTTRRGQATLSTFSIPQSRAALERRVEALRRLCARPGGDYRGAARELFRLLIAPASRQLAGKKRLIVCPDGPLWGLPFAVLPAGAKSRRFLLEKHEIVYAYSATAAQAALLAGKARRARPAQSLLALANPQFSGAPQVGPGGRAIIATSRAIVATSRAIVATSRDVLTGQTHPLPALPGTQWEANALKADFPGATIWTQANAQESRAKSVAGRFRYLHFATHGIFNDAAPLLSSVALAQPPESSLEDGFLTAREIFDLRWNADLVVLSACDSGQGQKRGGEGIVGLTWALFVAGAPSQVVSQWAVDDRSTATLMKHFYDGLGQHRAKSAALRAASLSLRRDRRHSHPYYWAPFVLMGDWR